MNKPPSTPKAHANDDHAPISESELDALLTAVTHEMRKDDHAGREQLSFDDYKNLLTDVCNAAIRTPIPPDRRRMSRNLLAITGRKYERRFIFPCRELAPG